jgi:hypothetical protein
MTFSQHDDAAQLAAKARYGVGARLHPALPQVADPPVRARHIVVCRNRFARAISTQGHNVRLAIWLAGLHICIYDEFGEQHHRFGAR